MKRVLLITTSLNNKKVIIPRCDDELMVSVIDASLYRGRVDLDDYSKLTGSIVESVCGAGKYDYIALGVTILSKQLVELQTAANKYKCTILESEDDGSDVYCVAVPDYVHHY